MQAPHAIQTLRFELRADAVPLARQLPDRFSALCRQQLGAVLEEEFAAHCPPHRQLRLPQLVLELPPVADCQLEAELPGLLRRALRTALSQATASEGPAVVDTPAATSWLAALEHFLRRGYLPWQVAEGAFTLDNVLRSVAKHQAKAFRVLLVQLGQTAELRQRLIWQFNAEQLQVLLLVLEPSHAPLLHAYLLAALSAHRQQPLMPVTEKALRSIVSALVLADLLLNAGTAFNRRAFIERQVRQLAAQYNLSFTQLLQQLAAAKVTASPSTQSVLFVLIEELHQQHRPAESARHEATGLKPDAQLTFLSPWPEGTDSSAKVTVADSSAATAALLTYYLQNGSLPLAAPALTQPQLTAALTSRLAQGWPAFRALLQAGGPAALRRLAHFLPEPLLQQVLRLAAPGQVRLVQGVMESFWQQGAAPKGEITRQDLWEHTLQYLLREDFRPFSSPALQQELTQQLAPSAATRREREQQVLSSATAAPSPLQEQEVLEHYLVRGQVPLWWQGGVGTPAQLRALWDRATQARALPGFLKTQTLAPATRQRLAEIADFSQLAAVLAARGHSLRSHPVGAALASLERREATGSANQPSPWLLFLRAAYLTFHLRTSRPTAAGLVQQLQRTAAFYRLPWPATLGKIRRLLTARPGLLTDAFFTALRHITLAKTNEKTAHAEPAVPSAQSHLDLEASSAASPVAVSAAGLLPAGAAARDLVFQLLRQQRPPWWAPAGLTTEQSRQLLSQVAYDHQAELQALVRAHGMEAEFRLTLAGLSSFAQLEQLVAKPGRAASDGLSPALLTTLDQQMARTGQPVAQLLRQAYLTAALSANPADSRMLTGTVRTQALRAGISWRTVLQYVAWLHRQLPALAAAPFFAALLVAAATRQQVAGNQQRIASRTVRVQQRLSKPSSSALGLAATAFQEFEQYLRTGQHPSSGSAASATGATTPALQKGTASGVQHRFAAQWKPLLQPEHRPQLQQLRPLLVSGTVRARLLAELSEPEFWQLLRLLYPDHYRLAARLAADWQQLSRQGIVRLKAPGLLEVLLAFIQGTPATSWRPDALVQELLAAEELLWPPAKGKRSQSRTSQLLGAIAHRGLVLRGPLEALLTLHHQAHQTQQVPKPMRPTTPIPFTKEDDTPKETVYIANAGLVLLWPFLTMLFDRLGYLENQQFRDGTAQQRAALLLQFLASGAEEAPEYQLPLNKLLCGISQGRPLPRELLLTDAEKEMGQSLLQAVTARWEVLKNTSVTGLRETFLLRSGKLEWLPERIMLTVEPKTLDILLDQRPWSISIIKLPWMVAPLYVTWR